MKNKLETNNIKISIFLVIIVLVFFILIGVRTVQLALSSEIDGINLQAFASSRTTKTEILTGKRGTIYDKNGDVLAQNVSSYTLIAYLDDSRTTDINNPKHVVDKEYTAKMLATVLDISEEKILTYLSKENIYQTEFGSKGKGLTELTKDSILSLGLPGIDFIETQKRYYPYGDFASYTLGYAKTIVKEDEDGQTKEEIVGEMGIEKQFNEELSGEDGYTFYQKDRNGYKIAGTKEVTVPATDGNDVYLTLDSNIQLFVERALDKIDWYKYFEWQTLMVVDAKTGAILANASTPSFDPNLRNMTNYLDYSISYPFEPGSTMKIFSYMAAMENGTYKGDATYKSGVYVTKDGTEIGDHDRRGWGNITLDYGFVMSSNVGVINMINDYMGGNGSNVLRNYYKKLGFGTPTGIELPKEASGKISFKYETEVYNAGFGQGITVTPMQQIKALTSLSNNGVLLQPYIVDKIVNSETDDIIYRGKKKELDKVASKETVEHMKGLMRDLMETPKGTGYFYYMNGYDVIAKTGTAQVSSGNGYRTDTVIRSFAGLYPGDDPSVIVFYAAKDNSSYGMTPMRTVLQDLVVNVSKYLDLDKKEDEEVSSLKEYTMASFINKKTSSVIDLLDKEALKYEVIGTGDKIIKQYPSVGVEVSSIDKIFLITNDTNIKMPNVMGYSNSEVKVLLDLLNVKYEIEGTGYVVSQSINKDVILKKDDIVKLVLKPKF